MAINSTRHTAASRVMRGIKDSVAGQVEDQKGRAADSIVGLAEAARRLSDELRVHNEALARAVGTAGSRLNGVADRVREADPAEMAQTVARFARQRPVVFVGAAFVVGLGVSQLLKTAATGHGASAMRDPTGTLEDLSVSSAGA